MTMMAIWMCTCFVVMTIRIMHPRLDIANILLQNDGTGQFTDVTDAAGLQLGQLNTWAGAWADLNNDGYTDLIIAYPQVLWTSVRRPKRTPILTLNWER